MSAPTPAPVASSGWKVVGQVQKQQLQGQTFTQGFEVSFVTGRGANGYVFVPLADFTPAGVMAAIAPIAAQLDMISTLSNPAG